MAPVDIWDRLRTLIGMGRAATVWEDLAKEFTADEIAQFRERIHEHRTRFNLRENFIYNLNNDTPTSSRDSFALCRTPPRVCVGAPGNLNLELLSHWL